MSSDQNRVYLPYIGGYATQYVGIIVRYFGGGRKKSCNSGQKFLGGRLNRIHLHYEPCVNRV